LADLHDNFHFLPHFKSKTTELIFTIFSNDVEQLVELLMPVFARRYPIPFCPIYATELVAMATSLKLSEKRSDWSTAIQYLPHSTKIV